MYGSVYVYVHLCVHIHTYLPSPLLKQPGSNDTPIAISKTSIVFMVSKYHSPTKRTGFLGERADSRSGVLKVR